MATAMRKAELSETLVFTENTVLLVCCKSVVVYCKSMALLQVHGTVLQVRGSVLQSMAVLTNGFPIFLFFF